MYKEIQNISTTSDTIISKIWYPPINNYACQKQIFISDKQCIEKSLRESNMLSILKDNPNCIRLYNTSSFPSPESNSFTLITELCENGNLSEMGLRLKQNNQNFSTWMIYYIKKSIKFLKSLQIKQISHRDIKPENIFITSDWDIKFGDFGSSTSTLCKSQFTIQGSPYYLSPELREGFNEYEKGRGGIYIEHSPFKSDVYSLGLIFLYMLTMETIDEEFTELKNLEKNIIEYSEKIENEYLRDLVRWMLKILPNERPDFVQLELEIERSKIFQCYVCRVFEIFEGISCGWCFRDYHPRCLSGNICESCGFQMKVLCEKCGKEVERVRKCGHLLCESCAECNFVCFECCPIVFVTDQQYNLALYPPSMKCFNCKLLCILQENFYFCHTCSLRFCPACKRISHSGPCTLQTTGIYVVCSCGLLITDPNFDEIFFHCYTCFYKCLLCFGSKNTSHKNCSLLFLTDFPPQTIIT